VARTYREAGVNLEEARRAIARIGEAAAGTRTPAVLGGVGGFAGLLRFDPERYTDPVLVASTDPIGTKLLVAISLRRYDTIGLDLVHQNLNDIAVAGAEPLFFLDYLAMGRLEADVAAEIVGGVASACAAAGVPLIGGETAELPDLFREGDFDLSGFAVGAASRGDLIDGSQVHAGDALLGLPSSGLHTNGFSLARRIFPESEWRSTAPGLEQTIGEELLLPHRSYLAELRTLRAALRGAGGDLLACAHITGGGWTENIPRTLPGGVGVEVETGSWPVPLIFSLIQQRGDIADDEMFHTFNLGIGLTVVVRPEMVDVARTALPEARIVGRVVALEGEAPRVRLA
jgi:phosphoribosylformylglycinamidine cyclo-ligase